MNRRVFTCMAATMLALAACTPDELPQAEHPEETTATGPTNRIDIPSAVVQNLGITFAKVERRRVDRTLRIPGAFETPPEAERVYRAPLGGRVTLFVSQYSRVQSGDAIAIVDSPQWRDLQLELDGLDAELTNRRADLVQAQAQRKQGENTVGSFPDRLAGFDVELAAMAVHKRQLEKTRDLWVVRIAELEDLAAKGAGRATELAEVRAAASEADGEISHESVTRAQLERAKADLEFEEKLAKFAKPALEAAEAAANLRVSAAESSFNLKLRSAGATLGVGLDSLKNSAWRTIDAITIRATAPGIMLELTAHEGESLEAGDSLCHVLNDKLLRFRARGLQSDLGKLRDGLNASVVPPAGGTLGDAAPASGVITLAPMADADSRLLDIIMKLEEAPEWARPGVSGELEVVWDEAKDAELAVPTRALIRDGLDVLFFVRDPNNDAKVVRTVARIGPSDGRWTVVYSGVMEGSEVVVEGTYELKLTGAGKALGGGHFHADGTFHATPD